LAANVRVETERRLKALEAELGQAEQAKKERTLSVKYHKVKFFGISFLELELQRNHKNIAFQNDKRLLVNSSKRKSV
jgi:hypothetical protein